MSKARLAKAKRAVDLARQALEADAAEARTRGWGSPAPDSASVATLAAGILVSEAIERVRRDRVEIADLEERVRELVS